MGIVAWIVLGLVTSLLANMLIPGRRPPVHRQAAGFACSCASERSGQRMAGQWPD
jgi:uncharacterized membrane protein YeaQ/YmgE (transglycosylase-associated protein family)